MKNVRHMLEKLEKLHPQIISAGGIDAERLRKEPQPSRHVADLLIARCFSAILAQLVPPKAIKSHEMW